jgi:hypothetical protein
MKSDTVSPVPRLKDDNETYIEVVAPPIWLLGFVLFLFASLALAVWAALGNNPGIGTLVLLTISVRPI